MAKPVAVDVNILDKSYQIACDPDEEHLLHNAAKYLSDQMRDIRDKGSVIGSDRVAVMAALNMSYELIKLKKLEEEHQEVSKRVTTLLYFFRSFQTQLSGLV